MPIKITSKVRRTSKIIATEKKTSDKISIQNNLFFPMDAVIKKIVQALSQVGVCCQKAKCMFPLTFLYTITFYRYCLRYNTPYLNSKLLLYLFHLFTWNLNQKEGLQTFFVRFSSLHTIFLYNSSSLFILYFLIFCFLLQLASHLQSYAMKMRNLKQEKKLFFSNLE